MEFKILHAAGTKRAHNVDSTEYLGTIISLAESQMEEQDFTSAIFSLSTAVSEYRKETARKEAEERRKKKGVPGPPKPVAATPVALLVCLNNLGFAYEETKQYALAVDNYRECK